MIRRQYKLLIMKRLWNINKKIQWIKVQKQILRNTIYVKILMSLTNTELVWGYTLSKNLLIKIEIEIEIKKLLIQTINYKLFNILKEIFIFNTKINFFFSIIKLRFIKIAAAFFFIMGIVAVPSIYSNISGEGL